MILDQSELFVAGIGRGDMQLDVDNMPCEVEPV
jgi:hypothetical protein